MSEITIPYHLAIPTIVCVAGLGMIIFFRKILFKKNNWFWISVTIFLVIYLFFVGKATFLDIYYQWDLNRYDLNRDGFFDGQEITKDLDAAMERLTNGVGRDFSLATGFIFALVVSGTVYLVGRLKSRLVKGD